MVSVVSLGELQLGVLNAGDVATPSRRADTLALARTAEPVPISEAIMASWGALGRGLPVVTQDEDFDQMTRAHRPLLVVKV